MKTALVIGASRGIGLQMAQSLSKDHTVYATARDRLALNHLTAQGMVSINVDVTDTACISYLRKRIQDVEFDLIVYVAGVYGTVDNARQLPSASDFDLVMHTNVLGAMQSIPLLVELVKPRGKFIFISSELARIESAQGSMGWIYRVSKAALNMAVKSASNNYPDIVMSVMNPGWVKTDMGGDHADLEVLESVTGMLSEIEKLTVKDSGRFLGYNGESLKW